MDTPTLPARPRDPGTPFMATIAWVAAAILVAITVFDNQFSDGFDTKSKAAPNEVEPPSLDAMTVTAKMFTKLAKATSMTGANLQQVIGEINKASKTPAEVFRSAIVANELLDAEAAIARLDKAESMNLALTTPSMGLTQDIEATRRLMKDPKAELTDIEREGLQQRHGWFADLLLTRGLPDTDPARQAVIGGGPQIIVGIVITIGVLFIAVVGGLAAFIVMIVRINTGQVHRAFVPPAPGGSVYLEMVPVFVLAFVAMHFLAGAVPLDADGHPPAWLRPVTLGVQFSLLGLTLYPLLRGVSWAEHTVYMGWHAGRGFWREVGAGVVGYFAGLPIVALGMAAMLAVTAIKKEFLPTLGLEGRLAAGVATSIAVGGVAAFLSLVMPKRESRPGMDGAAGFGVLIGLCAGIATFGLLDGDNSQPKNPVVDLLGGGSTLVLLIFAGMAVVWAPLAEESFFRGALYRHLRSRVGMGLAAIASAITFGVMHGYDFVLLVGVITLGFNFALMREWRGSLIAPMTAHALHNGTLMVIMLTLLRPLIA